MTTMKQGLIDLFKLDKMSPEKAAETADRLAKLVFESTLIRVLPLLSESDLEEYEDIIESGQAPEVLFNFIASKVPTFENIISEEADLLHKEMSGELEALTS